MLGIRRMRTCTHRSTVISRVSPILGQVSMAESISPIARIEQLLRVAVQFGACTSKTRFDRLAKLTCVAFDSDGCTIIHSTGDFAAVRVASQDAMRSQDSLDRRIHKLL